MTELQRLAHRYVRERVDRGELVPRTAEIIRSRLWDFAANIDARPANITRRHIETWMARPGLSPSYRRSRLSTVRVFCRWCVIHGHMRRDPTLGVTAPPLPASMPRALSAIEVGQVLASLPDARARVIVLLSVQEGLRRKEVAEAQLGDVDLHNRSMLVRGKGGRGGVTRTVWLTDQTCHAITTYLAGEGHRAGPLIRNRVHPDRGLTPHTVGEMVSRWMLESGVKAAPGDGKTMHAFRHSCAHHMLDAGATTEQVQQVLGHASIRTTQVYTRGRVEDLRAAMDGRAY